jgi:hypothetical protein
MVESFCGFYQYRFDNQHSLANGVVRYISTVWSWRQNARISRILYSQSLPPTSFNLQTTPA